MRVAAVAAVALAPVLSAVLAPARATAQDRPPAFPARDAAVAYRVTGAGATSGAGDTLRMAWLAAERKVRMDVAPGTWTLLDRAANVGTLVVDAERRATRVPLNPATMARHEPGPEAAFTREGADRVAGTACTVWAFRLPDGGGGGGRACMTDDGLVLRSETAFAGGTARMEATEVRVAPQDPARFRVPDGYEVVEPRPPRQPRRAPP